MTVGGVAATNVMVTTTSITADTPVGARGPADVVVTNTDSGTATDAGGFTYFTVPGDWTVLPASNINCHSPPPWAATSPDDGGSPVTTRGVLYATTASNATFQLNSGSVKEMDATTGGAGMFTVDVSGLSNATEYSFVAFATNAAGTTY